MDLTGLQSIVINYIKSNSLKNAIINEGTVFTLLELCKIIYEYVEKFEDKIILLRKIVALTNDIEIVSYVKFIIDDMETQLQNFKTYSSDCVFELHIKDTPDSYDERYICKSFDSALNMIDEFYKQYGNEEGKSSRYSIEKRKIYNGCTDIFDEDFRGRCTLNNEREICDFYPHESNCFYNCDGFCYECERLCMSNISIKFPSFVGYKDLVRYYDFEGKIKYGVSWDEPGYQSEECYIIPLDCLALRYNNFDKAHEFHEHIPYPYVEKASEMELNEENMSVYRKYLSYLEENDGCHSVL